MRNTGKHISSYIEYLRDTCKLNVTVHSAGAKGVQALMGTLAPYNIHSCGYCMFMKTNRSIWDKCIENQYKVVSKLKENENGFFGMCYLGVCEFVYPIFFESEISGFICVSGYTDNSEQADKKIKLACLRFGLDYQNVKQVYNKELSSKIPDKALVDTLIYPLICMIRQMSAESTGDIPMICTGGESYIYAHILTHLQLNFKNNITVDELCKLCHCSSSHISHIFPKMSGTSISAYINRLRIDEAKILLTSSSLSIKEIAYNIGYNDSNYFSNVFKRMVGVSPRQFRNKH